MKSCHIMILVNNYLRQKFLLYIIFYNFAAFYLHRSENCIILYETIT